MCILNNEIGIPLPALAPNVVALNIGPSDPRAVVVNDSLIFVFDSGYFSDNGQYITSSVSETLPNSGK